MSSSNNTTTEDDDDDVEDLTLSRSSLMAIAIGNYVIGRVLDELHLRQQNHVIALTVFHGISIAAYAWFYYSSVLVVDAASTQLTDNTGKLSVDAQAQVDSIVMGGRLLIVSALSQLALLLSCIMLISNEHVGAILNTITIIGATAATCAMVKLTDPADETVTQ